MMFYCGVVFVVALATIITALAFEHFGGYVPCELCLKERYAYYFAVPATLVAWLAASVRMNGAARILLVLIALAFMCNAALAVYHAGAEWKWWPGPSTCGGGFDLTWGQGGIVDTPIIRCDEASGRFLWLSFAGWDAVVSAFLAVVAALGATRRS
jgi:disulfide bond formation protein DsbB